MDWKLKGAAASLVLVSALGGGSALAAERVPYHGVQVASLFGESDDEKAARLQHENDQDSQLSDLKRRVQDLEQSLQQMTGQNELLNHRVQELSERIDRQQKDFDYKLCTLAAQQLGAGTAADQSGGSLPCDAGPGSAGGQPAGGGTLGTLPQGEAQPSATRSQYDEALNLLARMQYDAARAAFRSFADANPKDDLAPQALYWVGNIAMVQKDYTGAAQTFAEEIQKYPSNPKNAESMLKLGQSLLALGQKKNGCLTLEAIKKSKYPKAPAQVFSQAASVRASSCKKD